MLQSNQNMEAISQVFYLLGARPVEEVQEGKFPDEKETVEDENLKSLKGTQNLLNQYIIELRAEKLDDSNFSIFKKYYAILDTLANSIELMLEDMTPQNEQEDFLLSFGDTFITFVNEISKKMWKETFKDEKYLDIENEILNEIKKGEFEDIEVLCNPK